MIECLPSRHGTHLQYHKEHRGGKNREDEEGVSREKKLKVRRGARKDKKRRKKSKEEAGEEQSGKDQSGEEEAEEEEEAGEEEEAEEEEEAVEEEEAEEEEEAVEEEEAGEEEAGEQEEAGEEQSGEEEEAALTPGEEAHVLIPTCRSHPVASHCCSTEQGCVCSGDAVFTKQAASGPRTEVFPLST